MKRVLYVTNDDYNFYLMSEYFKQFADIELVSPKKLDIQVNFDYNGILTEVESAVKLAQAYYDLTKLPTITNISGLYIDKFRQNEQPGQLISNIDGKVYNSNELLVDDYISRLLLRGGRSLAHYVKGLCFIDESGNIHTDTFDETEFLLTSKKCSRLRFNSGLECISFDLDAQKYFNERSKEEEQSFYKELFDKCCDMVNSFLLNNVRGK